MGPEELTTTESNYDYREGLISGRYRDRTGARLMGKGQEARAALGYVLGAIQDTGVSLDAIEAACKTIRAHTGE